MFKKEKIFIFLPIIFFILFFYKFIFLKEIFFSEDIMRCSLPLRNFATNEFNKGKIPFWSPYLYSGFPVFAAAQDGLFYPFNIIIYKILPVYYALTFSQIFSFFLAFLSTFFFIRFFNISYLSATIGAIIFSLSGFPITHYRNIAFIAGYPYLPLILLFLLKFFQTKKNKYLILFTLSLSFQFLSGHPQLPFYSILTIIIYLAYLFYKKEKDYFKNSLTIIIFIFLSFLLVAFQYFPLYSLSKECGNLDISKYDYITYRSMPFYLYLQFLFPFINGSHSFNCYYGPEDFFELTIFISITAFIVILINLKKLFKLQEFKFFWLLGFFAIFFSIGSLNPLYRILAYIPPFNFFRVPARYNYLLIFVLSLFFAKSFDLLFIDKFEKNKKITKLIIILFIIFFTGFILIFCFQKNFITNFKTELLSNKQYIIKYITNYKRYGAEFYIKKLDKILNFQKWNFLIISMIYLVNFFIHKINNFQIKKYLLVLIILIEIFLFGFLVIETNHKNYFTKEPKISQYLKEKNQNNFYRIYSWNRGKMYSKFKDYDGYFFDLSPYEFWRNFLNENYANLFNIHSFGGDNTLVYLRYRELEKRIKSGNYDLLKIYSTKYLITGIPITNINAKEIKFYLNEFNDNVYIYEFDNYLPLYYFVDNFFAVDNSEEALNAVIKNLDKIIKGEMIVIENFEESKNIKKFERETNSKIRLIDYDYTRIKFEIINESAGFLIFNEAYFPEWQVKINNKISKIYRTNYYVKSVFISEPGTNIIEIYYSKKSFYIGLIFSVFSLFILIIFLTRIN
ncbi:MAG TPA: YfhO family protein [bacterium]|nr:YfhO family protein [bacterium]HPQ18211.1 YfhO family protein [bacterium]